ncbi:hypothetical protein ABI59_18515 [Acidobacteria bacterium Mor1]|nr:hypothetical protein ABI59_18515 [Acidobacteria bacterium Mor1]
MCTALLLVLCGLAAASAAAETGAEPVFTEAWREAQAGLAEMGQLGLADAASRNADFRNGLERYLDAAGAELREGARFDLGDEDGFRRAYWELRIQIEKDLSDWHLLHALDALSRLLVSHGDPICARLLGQSASVPEDEDALNRRTRCRNYIVLPAVADQIGPRLREAFERHAESDRIDLVQRAATLLRMVMNEHANHRVTRVVFSDDALPEAMRLAAEACVTDRELPDEIALSRFEAVGEVFPELRSSAGTDELLILLERFDRLGTPARRGLVEPALIGGVRGYIDHIIDNDEDAVEAMETVDALTRMVAERGGVVHPDLEQPRILEILVGALKDNPDLLRRYIEVFHRDFHALNPAGFEMVIFNLVDLLLDAAEEEALPGPEEMEVVAARRKAIRSAVSKEFKPGGQYYHFSEAAILEAYQRGGIDRDTYMELRAMSRAERRRAHEEADAEGDDEEERRLSAVALTMILLEGYHHALVSTKSSLPEANRFFVAQEQQATLERFYRYYQVKNTGALGELERDNPRFVELTLDLILRLAHAADPDDLETLVIGPIRERGSYLQSSGKRYAKPFLSKRMTKSIAALQKVIESNRRLAER